MSDYDEKNYACGGKQRISSELESDMHVEVVASEKRENRPIYGAKNDIWWDKHG